MKRQRQHRIPPADGPRQAVYSTVITPINRSLPIDRVISGSRSAHCHKQSRTYSKFRPIACSTPKLQTPILSILERQSSYKPRRIHSREASQLECSLELLTNIIDSEKYPTDKGQGGIAEGATLPMPNCTWQLERNLSSGLVTLNESINSDPCVMPKLDSRNEIVPSTALAVQLPWQVEPVEELFRPLSPHKDNSNVDLFAMESQQPCQYHNLQNKVDSPSPEQELPNIIPYVIVTSYIEDSVSENIIEDSPFTQTPLNTISDYESQRSDFLRQIEELIFNVLQSLNRSNEIGPILRTCKGHQLLPR